MIWSMIQIIWLALVVLFAVGSMRLVFESTDPAMTAMIVVGSLVALLAIIDLDPNRVALGVVDYVMNFGKPKPKQGKKGKRK